MTKLVKNYGELVYRTFLFALTSSIFVANLWLCQNFTSRKDFDNLQGGVIEIQKGLVRMEGVNSVLLDHETRIRVIEHSFPTRDMMRQTSYFDWMNEKEKKLSYNEYNKKQIKEN